MDQISENLGKKNSNKAGDDEMSKKLSISELKDETEFHLIVNPEQCNGDNVDLRGNYIAIPDRDNCNIVNLKLKKPYVFYMHHTRLARRARKHYLLQDSVYRLARKPFREMADYTLTENLCNQYIQRNLKGNTRK
ncbi:hypothetical protein HN011_003342 [Eciton burchellii]|nr:hypothetical protein HN011_003342 [Eciton burchellii]